MRRLMVIAALLAAVSCARAHTAEYRLVDLSSQAFGGVYCVNNAGQVVGSRYGHAAVWQDGVVTDLGTLGGAASEAYHINDTGSVVGCAQDASGFSRAFVWRDGAMIDLGAPAGTNSIAYGINNRGQVVGYYSTPSGQDHAFLWENGLLVDLAAPGMYSSVARAISDGGQVVGHARVAPGTSLRAYLWRDQVAAELPSLGPATTVAYDINENGQIVGVSGPFGSSRACLWQDGAVADLGAGSFSTAYSVNEHAQVVGYNRFVWQDGVVTLLPSLGGDARVYSINDNGWACGMADYVSGDPPYSKRAVVWIPVPEPSSLAALSIGLLAAGAGVRRRGRE